MAANQIHYKILRGIAKEEYKDEMGAKTYMEALLGDRSKKQKEGLNDIGHEEWKVVTYKKHKNPERSNRRCTIFVAKIHPKATTKNIWDFFQNEERILDIILPKKRDKDNNRIDFVKVKNQESAIKVVERLRNKKLMGEKIDLKVVHEKNSGKETGVLNDGKTINSAKKNNEEKNHPATTMPILEQVKLNAQPSFLVDDKFIPIELKGEDCFDNSMIGFSSFPMNRDILSKVMKELGINNISVKEISCWKFMITFSSEHERESFNWED